jgi:hypothetical protein
LSDDPNPPYAFSDKRDEGARASIQIASGYISPLFITDDEQAVALLADPNPRNPVRIFLYEHTISDARQISPLLERMVREDRAILIVAEDVIDDALILLVTNVQRGGFRAAAVPAPRSVLEEIVAFTGGMVVNRRLGIDLSDFSRITDRMLGSAREVRVAEHKTVIIEGAGNRKSPTHGAEAPIAPPPTAEALTADTRPLDALGSIAVASAELASAALAAPVRAANNSSTETAASKGPPRPAPTNPAMRKWMRDRVTNWPDDKKAPTDQDDFEAAAAYFDESLGRDALRSVRRDETPAEWRNRGPRQVWGMVKAKSAKPRPA